MCGLSQKRIMQATRENLPLTAIRGVAAVWVVALHVQPGWFPGAPAGLVSGLLMGQAAVDIFFVLSGFILAQVYGEIHFEQAPRFWLRRICRVYPLHLSVMAVLALSVLAANALRGSAHPHDWRDFVVVTLLLNPFLQDGSTWSPQSWSVGVELLCYAMFPLTMRLMGRLPGLLCAGVVVALALAEALVLHGYDAGSSAVLRGLVGFHLGAALCLLLPHLPVRPAPAAALAGVVGIALGIGAASQTAIVLAAAVTIVSLAPARGLVASALSRGPLVWLGRVSFSIYLLHAQLQVALNRALSQFIGPWALTALFVAILIPLSEATYRFIEQPGRRLPSLLRRA